MRVSRRRERAEDAVEDLGQADIVVRGPRRRAAIRLSTKSGPAPAPSMAAGQRGLVNHRFGLVNQPEKEPPRTHLHLCYLPASQPPSDKGMAMDADAQPASTSIPDRLARFPKPAKPEPNRII